MIFVDSNIPMYLVGAPHPNKAHARQLLESAITTGDRLVCSAEVLQEILHRYVSIGRRDALHVAVMRRRDVRRIMSFDTGFDTVPGLSRIPG